MVALGAGVIGLLADLDPTWPPLFLRAGIVLFAVWFAGPAFARVPRRVGYGLAAVAVVLVIRPRLILWALAVGLVVAVAAGRTKR